MANSGTPEEASASACPAIAQAEKKQRSTIAVDLCCPYVRRLEVRIHLGPLLNRWNDAEVNDLLAHLAEVLV